MRRPELMLKTRGLADDFEILRIVRSLVSILNVNNQR